MTIKMQRMWVNAPSTLQPAHCFHGRNVIVDDSTDEDATIYFAEGNTISAVIHRRMLSPGWQPDALLEAALNALPYLTDVVDSPEQLACFKRGVVQKHVKELQDALVKRTGEW